jgi:pantoate--beta-alanine ligase
MQIIRTKNELKEAIRSERKLGKKVALVPTMGALHQGHISLVNLAKQHAESVVASIFVNPTQFGPNEDFSKYPRTEKEDIGKLEAFGVAIAYIPTIEEMYPEGSITQIHIDKISEELCGAFRPGHFNGVATIVTKLFIQALPDIALFGEKDYQQLYIIRQVVRDLDIPVNIIGAPIIREKDGLAMSSRNRYLSEQEQKVAVSMYKTLSNAAKELQQGKESDDVLLTAKELLLHAGFIKVDYVELRDATTLSPVKNAMKPARLLAAAYLGTMRLIDNLEVTI